MIAKFRSIARIAVGVAWLAGVAWAGAFGQEVGVEVKRVRAEKLANVPGNVLTAITVSFAPGGKSVEHHHAGSVFAFVLTGAIKSENSATGPAKVYKAGESFFEPAGSKHLVCDNASATEPASLLAVFVAEEGAQLTTFNIVPRPTEPQKGKTSTAGQRSATHFAIPAGFAEHDVEVNGVRIHYVIGGKGRPVVLLHGYAQTGHMWNPIMSQLAKNHTVVVPDLRGAGGSAKPESGYDKKNMAVDIHELTTKLGLDRVSIVGHDIGLMVAYAFAAQFPQATDRVVLLDAFLPGIGNWKEVWLLRDLWHFHFYGETPLALVMGRERTYFEHFWNDFAADRKNSVPEADRQIYALAYSQPNGMRAGFEYFRNFEQDAADFAKFGKTKLPMPVFVLTGEKASGEFLIEQAKLVATNVNGRVVKGAGHWLMEESPQTVIPAIVEFINQ